MAVIITILCLGLIGSVLCNVFLHNELLDERNKRFEAEAWIDPIEWEATK